MKLRSSQNKFVVAFQLQFSYYDGSPYLDSVNTITVSYGTDYDKTKSTPVGTGKIGADGVANIAINLPDTGTTYIYIFVSCTLNAIGLF